MPITKSPVAVLAAQSVAAGSTKAAPGLTGPTVDCRTYYGGELTFKITNGTAPGVGLTIGFQVSHDGVIWADYSSSTGDTVLNGGGSGAILLDRGVMYLRAVAYGNTTNAVTVEAYLQATTAV